MGLFRSATIVLVSVVMLSILTENDRIKGVPVVGKLVGDNIDKNKHNIVLLIAALVGYFI